MKLLYVLHRFLPRFFSGTETYTYQLAQEMQQRGHGVQIFCADEIKGGPDYRIKVQEGVYNSLKIYRINFNREKTPDIIGFSYDNPMVAEHFDSFLSRTRPDLVHITSFQYLSASIIDPIKSLSIPVVFTATDYWCFCPKSNLLAFDSSLCKAAEVKKCISCLICISSFYARGLKKLNIPPSVLAETFLLVGKVPGLKKNKFFQGKEALEKRSTFILEKLKNLDLIITPTPNLQEYFLNSGLSPKKIMLSGYGFNSDWIKQPSHYIRKQEPLRFGYIGMLAQMKGVDILIRSFNRFSPSEQAHLKIYGDDSHFPSYVQQLKKLAQHNPNISFMETFPPDKLGKILAKIDVLIVPSLWYENAPTVILGAFAAGIPVVGSDVPGISFLVKDEVNGLLFARGDTQALTRCLARLLQEPDLLPKLRKNVPEVKSIEENGNELEIIYHKLINDNKHHHQQ